MSLQEKKALYNIFTSILILGGYTYYTFGIHGDTNLPQVNDIVFWAKWILTMMVVTVVLKIIIEIIFYAIYKIATNGDDPDFMDDYDKQIEMRSGRNAHYIFMIGFVVSFIPVANGAPIYYMFIIMISSGFGAGIMEDLWKIYYYRKGF